MAWVDIDYARSVVEQMYPNDNWRRRVRGMSDDQVLAIYCRYEEERERKKSSKKAAAPTQPKKEEPVAIEDSNENIFAPDYSEQLSFGGIF